MSEYVPEGIDKESEFPVYKPSKIGPKRQTMRRTMNEKLKQKRKV